MEYRNGSGDVRVAASVVTISKKALVMLLVLAVLVSTTLSVGLTMWLFGGGLPAGSSGNGTNTTEESSGSSGSTSGGALSAGDETSYNSVIKDIQDTVVSITTETVATDMWARNYVTQGAGSGVIISEDGYILTCNHVIDGARTITVTLNDQKEYQAQLVGADPSNDLAVLKINASGLSAAKYGDSSKLQVGDRVIAIGNPLGTLSGTVTTGIISSLSRDLTIDGKTLNLLQTDASINPGNSGGALFDASGNLIGIVVAKSTGSDVEGLGFAIPINRGQEVATALIENGYVASGDSGETATAQDNGNNDGQPASDTPMIGISLAIVDEGQALVYGLPSAGLYITEVLTQEAKAGGLKEYDRIVSVNGSKVESYQGLQNILRQYSVGDTVTVVVERDGELVDAQVTLT